MLVCLADAVFAWHRHIFSEHWWCCSHIFFGFSFWRPRRCLHFFLVFSSVWFPNIALTALVTWPEEEKNLLHHHYFNLLVVWQKWHPACKFPKWHLSCKIPPYLSPNILFWRSNFWIEGHLNQNSLKLLSITNNLCSRGILIIVLIICKFIVSIVPQMFGIERRLYLKLCF